WNRLDAHSQPRPLHIEESMQSINWKQGPVEPVQAVGFAEARAGTPDTRQPLVRSDLFNIEYIHLDYSPSNTAFSLSGMGRLRAFIVLRGEGRITWPGGEETVTRGEVWLLPAALRSVFCLPSKDIAALLCSMP